jgi:hypothetical protein
MSPSADDSPGDPWTDASMVLTARQFFGLGSDSDQPDSIRFRRGVVRVIRNRLRQVGDVTLTVPAVFFLMPGGPPLDPDTPREVIPMLDNGLSEVEGRLFFVGPVAAHGIAIGIDEWSDAEVFSYSVTDLGLAGVPAILFEPRTDPVTARFYPLGLDHPDDLELLRISESPISLAEVFDVVDRIHQNGLATPKAQGTEAELWERPLKKWVSDRAERRVQLRLKSGLIGAFPTCVVREEQDQTSGRLDLEIEESNPDDPSNIVRHALLELKVLRSFNKSGARVFQEETNKHVADGVTQAASYRDERGTRAAALCCFDMRSSEDYADCFMYVRADADECNVELRSWRIFSSAKEYREAQD